MISPIERMIDVATGFDPSKIPPHRYSVLVCGGRDYNDAIYLHGFLSRWHQLARITEIITGGCTGADALAAKWADENHVKSIIITADWKKLGKSAGPFRNQKMLELNPNCVLAFPGGRGTADMVRRAKRSGIRVEEIPSAEEVSDIKSIA